MGNNFSSRLIEGRASLCRAGRLRLSIRLPWYRSLPLSTVEITGLSIDGRRVPPEAVSFVLDQKRFPLAQLPELTQEWWYVLDSAVLEVELPELHGTARHEVELTLTLFPPYILGLCWITKSKLVLDWEPTNAL